MALSESTINFNYNQAIQKAAELATAIGGLDVAIEELNTAIGILKSNWEGDNSQAFVAKCIQERDKLQETRADIQCAVDAIRRIAQEVKEAELRALAIARAQEAARRAAEEAARRAEEAKAAAKAAETKRPSVRSKRVR